MEAPEFIQKIDWELLKKQKHDLISSMGVIVVHNTELYDSLEGILSLIDSIQDYAVDEMGIEENVVFDLDDNEEE